MARSIVMLDMDGTLVDTMPEFIEAAVAVLKDRLGGDEAVVRQQVQERIGLPTRELVREFSDLAGFDRVEFTQAVEQVLSRLPPTPFPEVPGALASLKLAGYTLVLSSNTPQDVVSGRLEAAGLADHFDFALGTDFFTDLGKEDHPRIVGEQLGLSPDELAAAAAFVGDTPGDMVMARAVGIVAIGRLSGENGDELREAGADYLIGDLSELEPLLAKLR